LQQILKKFYNSVSPRFIAQVIKRNIREVHQPRIIQLNLSARTILNVWHGQIRRRYSFAQLELVEIDPESRCLRIIWKSSDPYTLYFADEWQMEAMHWILTNAIKSVDNAIVLSNELQSAFRPVSWHASHKLFFKKYFHYVDCATIIRLFFFVFQQRFSCMCALFAPAEIGSADRAMESSFVPTPLSVTPARMPSVSAIRI
jgi:hypothetical protein